MSGHPGEIREHATSFHSFATASILATAERTRARSSGAGGQSFSRGNSEMRMLVHP
jgi:hypothetical protein